MTRCVNIKKKSNATVTSSVAIRRWETRLNNNNNTNTQEQQTSPLDRSMAHRTTTAGLFLLFTVSIVVIFLCDAADATAVAAAETSRQKRVAAHVDVTVNPATVLDASQCAADCPSQCKPRSTPAERAACRRDCRTSCRVTCRVATRNLCQGFAAPCQAECYEQVALLCST